MLIKYIRMKSTDINTFDTHIQIHPNQNNRYGTYNTDAIYPQGYLPVHLYHLQLNDLWDA